MIGNYKGIIFGEGDGWDRDNVFFPNRVFDRVIIFQCGPTLNPVTLACTTLYREGTMVSCSMSCRWRIGKVTRDI